MTTVYHRRSCKWDECPGCATEAPLPMREVEMQAFRELVRELTTTVYHEEDGQHALEAVLAAHRALLEANAALKDEVADMPAVYKERAEWITKAASVDLENQRLTSEVAALKADAVRMLEALQSIGAYVTSDDFHDQAVDDVASFEDAYDDIVKTARAALTGDTK